MPFWRMSAAGECCQIQPKPAVAVSRPAAHVAATDDAPSSRASSQIPSQPARTPATSTASSAAFRLPGIVPRIHAPIEW